MTERFKLTNPDNLFQEMKCGINDGSKTLTFNEVVALLNKQDNRIEELESHFEVSLKHWKREYEQINNKTQEVLQSFNNRDLLDIERFFLNNLCRELGVKLE